MNIRDEYADEDPGLNLTPMIDVVFLLLIFFMVSTTFLKRERDINLDLPTSSEAGTVSEELEELVVNVLQDGTVVVGGAEVDENGLLVALRQAAALDPERQVTIRGDRLTAYEHVIRVMDYCGVAGLSNLAVSTIDGGS